MQMAFFIAGLTSSKYSCHVGNNRWLRPDSSLKPTMPGSHCGG